MPSRYVHRGGLWLVESIKLQVSLAKEPCKRQYSVIETRNLIDPTDRSHPIASTARAMYVYVHSSASTYMSTHKHLTNSTDASPSRYVRVHTQHCLYICGHTHTPHELDRCARELPLTSLFTYMAMSPQSVEFVGGWGRVPCACAYTALVEFVSSTLFT